MISPAALPLDLDAVPPPGDVCYRDGTVVAFCTGFIWRFVLSMDDNDTRTCHVTNEGNIDETAALDVLEIGPQTSCQRIDSGGEFFGTAAGFLANPIGEQVSPPSALSIRNAR
jgi:hypothetical protein